MHATEKFLVVINPFASRHQALQRAVVSAAIREQKPSLHLYINPQTPSTAQTSAAPGFGHLSLRTLTDFVEQHELPYDYEFSWSPDVEAAVVSRARDADANLIIYPLTEQVYNQHKGLTQSTWTLLRNSSCPVMLVTPDSTMQRKVILAAVNFQSPYPEYVGLNQRILARARWLAEKYGAKLYVVNAYNGSIDYPDYSEIRHISGLPYEQIRIVEGRPEKVVTDVAREVDADLVMIGTRNTHDFASSFRQNTAEKVLMNLNRDMIVVN